MSRTLSVVVIVICALVLSMDAAGPTFRPDVVFKGSALTGWTPLGDAEWKAQNGEIIGTPKQPGGGWLVLDKSFQDVAIYSNVTCTGGCKAGVLLRAEKTSDGMKGIYVSVTEGDLISYAVTLDRQGKEIGRTQLASAGRGGGGGGGRSWRSGCRRCAGGRAWSRTWRRSRWWWCSPSRARTASSRRRGARRRPRARRCAAIASGREPAWSRAPDGRVLSR